MSGTPIQPQYTFDPTTNSYKLVRFTLPACNNDFPNDPASYEKLATLWSQNVNGFTQQAILGDPWNSQDQANQTGYYNPLVTPIPKGSGAVDVAWIAFPNRLTQYLGQNQLPPNPYNLPQSTLNQLADTGELSNYPIPSNRCPQADWGGSLIPFGPYGPRGWLDEYCEFCVTRDANNNITRIDFTCENPEYYQTLWRIDPETVCNVFETALNTGAPASQHVTVTIEDLQLVDPTTGDPVIDPQTGRPAYNPLNKWNSGTIGVRTGNASQFSGGAMHLTATPNTLQTELGLGAGATVQRPAGTNNDPQALICCGQYGQNYRNSDPHIGQTINLAVGAGFNISLADPPGLYIQMPSFAQYELPNDPKLPKGARPEDCWTVIRGFEKLTDPITGAAFPGSFILHAAFQIPQAWIDAGVTFTVSDIKIAGQPIQYGSQVAATLEIALFGRPIKPVVSTPALPCVTGINPGAPQYQAQPIQSMYETVWNAYYGTIVHPPTNPPGGNPAVLASNSSIIPPTVPPGTTANLILTFGAALDKNSNPIQPTQVVFTNADGTPDSNISVNITSYNDNIYYAPPGNTYPSQNQLVQLSVTVAPNAAPGTRGVVIVSPGQNFKDIPPAPAYLVVGPTNS